MNDSSIGDSGLARFVFGGKACDEAAYGWPFPVEGRVIVGIGLEPGSEYARSCEGVLEGEGAAG